MVESLAHEQLLTRASSAVCASVHVTLRTLRKRNPDRAGSSAKGVLDAWIAQFVARRQKRTIAPYHSVWSSLRTSEVVAFPPRREGDGGRGRCLPHLSHGGDSWHASSPPLPLQRKVRQSFFHLVPLSLRALLSRACACIRSIRWVHASCLQQWLQLSRAKKCEVSCLSKCTHAKRGASLRRGDYVSRLCALCVLTGPEARLVRSHCTLGLP